MYLAKENLKEAAAFIVGGLWQDYRRALDARKPTPPSPDESAETAAHRAFLRRGYEMAMEDIERLPRELKPEEAPMMPATLLDPRD